MAANYAKNLGQTKPTKSPGPGGLSEIDENANVPLEEQQWNTLVSKLRKDMLKERTTNPPEKYRKAIDNYFRGIAKWVSEKQVVQ